MAEITENCLLIQEVETHNITVSYTHLTLPTKLEV